MSFIKFGIEVYSKYPRLFVSNVFLTLTLMALDMAALFSIAPVIGLLVEEGHPSGATVFFMKLADNMGLTGSVELFLCIFVTLNILSAIMYVVIDYFLIKTKYIIREDMILDACSDILHSNINYSNRQRQGDFINTVTNEVNRAGDAFTAITRMIAPAAQVLVLLAVPLYLSWQVTFLSLGSAALITLPIRYFRRHSYKWGQKESTTSNDFTTSLQETFSNIRLISSFGNEASAIRRVRNRFLEYRVATLAKQLLHTAIGRAYAPIGVILVLITFLLARHWDIALADIAIIIYAFHRIAGNLGIISTQRHLLSSLFPAYEQVKRFREQARKARPVFGNRPFTSLEKTIQLDNVSFSYPGAQAALRNVSITVANGAITALVGASGAGKSTVADILMGMQTPTSGTVLIDGISLSDYDLGSFRQHIGYVPQQNALFNTTIKNNIIWAKKDATDQEVIEACQQANAYDFIMKLDEKLDTVVGDRGVRLSGGQLQRIALARALVRKPALLILDEATSALDAESEKLIQQSVTAIAQHTAVVIIAHRLASVRSAGKIYVLEDGKIIEHGAFDTLANSSGHFARLVDMQRL